MVLVSIALAAKNNGRELIKTILVFVQSNGAFDGIQGLGVVASFKGCAGAAVVPERVVALSRFNDLLKLLSAIFAATAAVQSG